MVSVRASLFMANLPNEWFVSCRHTRLGYQFGGSPWCWRRTTPEPCAKPRNLERSQAGASAESNRPSRKVSFGRGCRTSSVTSDARRADLLAFKAEERVRVAESRLNAAGGFAAIRYVLDQARESGNSRELVSRLRSANACKTCAVGMGGDRGGMVNRLVTSRSVQEVGTSAGR